jgi:NADH-quinone oxidoreductase subunit L
MIAFAILTPMSRQLRNRARWISIAAIVTSALLSLAAFIAVWPGAGLAENGGHGEAAAHGGEAAGHAVEYSYQASYTMAEISGLSLDLGIALDPVAAIMLVIVSIVGACVQVYSIGYMHEDERVGWYYAVLSLFTSAMLFLVLASDLLLFFMAWEIMGLCSYLLIGFWHEQEAPRRASMKAFMTTRVGDIGFMMGLWVIFAEVGSFEFETVLAHPAEWSAGIATAAALLLLFGAMGKSAQVPLHVWLPDAMAGPTPASALIHAATMVAAGVFLVFRTFPIFEASGTAITVTLIIGAITALVGGLLATVQHDVKKVLAYSTISQLGYMFIALGAAGTTAALYHLTTHAFFKSLLFLGAGVIIHATHTQDMREMGGLRKFLPWTTATFTIGSLALAGVFPFSGFWSKDEILTVLWHEGEYVVWAAALFGAFITAFYVSRLWFRVFTGPEQQSHPHEGHKSMVAPMVLLAAITVVLGFLGPQLGVFLGHEIPWPALVMAGVSSLVTFSGIGLGWWVYGRRSVVLNTRTLKNRTGYLYDALVMKFYFDLTYERLIISPFIRLTSVLAVFDLRRVDGAVNGAASAWSRLAEYSWRFDGGVIDGAVNGVAVWTRKLGAMARTIQVGRVQTYQRLVVAATVFLMVIVVWIVAKG